jgi:signal transduction histidine kinase/uncharacterized protein HemY
MLLFKTTFGQSQKTNTEIEIEQLLDLSSKTTRSNPDSAIIYANTAITYAKDRQASKYVIQGYKKLGNIYIYADEQEKAREMYQQAIEYAQKIDDEVAIAYIQSSIAKTYAAESNFKKAIETLKVAQKHAIEHSDTLLLANTSLDIGVIHARKGAFYIAVEYFFKSIEYYEIIGETKYTIPLLNNIGSIYSEIEEYEKALPYLKTAKDKLEADSVKSYDYIAYVSSNMGRCHLNLKEFDKAIESYELALSGTKKLGNLTFSGKIYNQLGAVYLNMNELKQAAVYYKQAFDILKDKKDLESFSATLRGLANLEQRKKNYSKALKYIEESISINISIENLDDIVRDYKLLSSIHNDLGNSQKAYDYLNLHLELNDSLFTINKSAEVILLESKYNYKQEELRLTTEVEGLKKDKALQKSEKLILILALFIISLISVTLFWFFNKKRKENYLLKKDLENKAIIEQQAQELKELNDILEAKVELRTIELQTANDDLKQANYELRTFNYIASHDIKEPIRVISGYAGLIHNKLPNDLKESLGDYFNLIKSSTHQLYTLIEDFANYLSMSKNETIKKQPVDLNQLIIGVIDNLKETIDNSNGQILISNLPTIQSSNSLLFTIFKNLIENGLKYNNSENPVVNIDYQKTTNTHQIIISDNGIGIKKQYQEQIFEMFKRLHHRGEYEGSGIGLAIVKLSIDKLGGIVTLNSELGKGSQFMIKLPL